MGNNSFESQDSAMNFKPLIMEFIGVFALCYIGGLSLAGPSNTTEDKSGPSASLGHMLALGIMIYIGAATSGGQYNPAVTLALLTLRTMEDV